jgi:hypothetical protein
MAGPQQPSGVIEVAGETVVLGFELVGAEIDNLPARVARALQSSDVQQAIKKALDDFAQARLKNTPVTVSTQDAEALGKAIATQGGTALKDDVLKQIKDSSHYKALDQSLKNLAEQFKQSPFGAWLDKEKNWLYIVGAGAVIGGVAAMYVTRKGDLVTTRLLPMLGKQSHTFQPLGQLKLEVGVDKVTFTPSTRSASATTFVTAKWQQIKAELNITVTKADSKVTVGADGKVIIPIKPGVNATAGGAFNSGKNDWNLHVTVEVDVLKNVHLGVFAGVGKGGVGPMPSGDAFRAMPEPPRDSSRPQWFGGVGISGTF